MTDKAGKHGPFGIQYARSQRIQVRFPPEDLLALDTAKDLEPRHYTRSGFIRHCVAHYIDSHRDSREAAQSAVQAWKAERSA